MSGRVFSQTKLETNKPKKKGLVTRMAEATALWRKHNPGNELVSPDLGQLLTWLMDRIAELESQLQRLFDNPRKGTCVDCGASIWHNQPMIVDGTGEYHPLCRVVKQRTELEAHVGYLLGRIAELENLEDK